MFNILREIRLKKELTQKKVAQKLGIEQQSYARLESADLNSISLKRLNELSIIFEVPLETILENPNKLLIPVLGTIPAGIPLEAIEEIIDYEEIPQSMATTGNFFGLKVKGDSMSPRIINGDIVIVKKQEDAESGDICVVMVNGFDATLKQIKKDYNGITLVPFNNEYKPMFYSNKEIQELPVRIIGKVVELRGKF